jgi:NitT/TauT family transport system substrate-binding protein
MHLRIKVRFRKRIRSRLLTVFFLTILAVGLVFEPGQAQSVKKSGSTEKIMIADGSSINSAPLYVALQKGYFQQEGLQVVCRLFPSGKAALDAVREGRGDLATVADIPVMFAVMEGTRISVLASISESFRENAIVARKDRGIQSPGDLRGKKIGVPAGTAPDYFLDVFLIFHRVPLEKLKRIPLSIDRIPEALEKGDLDAVAIWKPLVLKLQDTLGSIGYIDYGRNLYHMTWNLAGPEDFVKGNPEAVKKILRALIRGAAFVKEKPQESRKIVAGYLGLTETQVARSWSEYAFQVTLHSLLLMNLENQARWAIRTKSIGNRAVPNFLDYFYFEGLEAVDPKAVTIIH